MRSRGFPLLALVCGTLISNGSSTPGLAAERSGAAALDAAMSAPSMPAAKPGSQQDNAEVSPAPEAGSMPGLASPVPDSREMLPAAPPVSLIGFPPAGENVKPGRGFEIPNDCLAVDISIDDYLWWLYERTPKVDTNKVVKHIRVTFKKRGKRRRSPRQSRGTSWTTSLGKIRSRRKGPAFRSKITLSVAWILRSS